MNDNNFLVIAVDGGAASGKSSTSRSLAEALDLLHVDTGSHYRALTHSLINAQIPYEPQSAAVSHLENLTLSATIHGRSAVITINNKEIPDEELRTQKVNNSVSHYAAIPELRTFLLNYQRSLQNLAKDQNYKGIVMEGRDVGSIILPDATYRFFLEADPETRAQRRALQGQDDAIEKRDQMDSTRKTAPLTCAEGSTRIDTSDFTLQEVVQLLLNIIHPS